MTFQSPSRLGRNPARAFGSLGRKDQTALVRRGVLAVLCFTALFYLTSLRGGYMADDHFHILVMSELPDWVDRHFNFFGLVRNTAEVEVFRLFGYVPWWASEDLRINFFRPLPTLTHVIDFTLFGPNPAFAHFMSILYYVFACYLVYRMLTRFLPESSRVLVVAVAIFALDDAHALSIQWIANRNESIGGAMVMLSFLAWLRLREGKGRYHGPLCALGFFGGLLSKESTLVLPVFVLAHALVFPDHERRPPRGVRAMARELWARARVHLGLHLVLFAMACAFLALYFGFGHGANSVYYINPLRNPALWAEQFFRSGFFHAVILATGVPLHILSSSPVHDYPLAAVALGGLTVAFWVLAWRWLRHERAFLFFVISILAGQVIVTTSFPDPRNLFLPSIGFAFLVARVMQEAWHRRIESRIAHGIVVTLAGLHLVLAPVLDQVCVYIVNGFEDRYRTLRDSLVDVVDYQNLPESGIHVFFLNWHQREMSAVYGLYLRRALPTGVTDYRRWTHNPNLSFTEKTEKAIGAERIHYYSLSLLQGDVDFRAVGDRDIVLAPRAGHFFPTMFEQLYTTGERYEVGQIFDAGPFRATLEAVSPANEILRVRFTFPEPLSSKRYRFMMYNGERFVLAPL